MLEELNPSENVDGLDDLNTLSDETTSQMEEVVPVEPEIATEPGISQEDPTQEDITALKPEVTNGISFKGGACVCSCDMSCTVGY